MRKFSGVILALFGALFCLSMAHTAQAQATRTWVSGVGDDANPCSRTAPCKTFAGAISKTAAAGEINCIDPGGYGALTITKSIAIICDGVEAGVLVSGTNGININAGVNDVVYLSGLDFQGLGTGLSGVNVIQAKQVNVVNSVIRGFTVAGVNVAPGASGVKVDVTNSVIADNGSGILFKPTSGASIRGLVDGTRLSHNTGDGIMVNGTTTTGSLKILVHDTSAAGNGSSGFVAYSNGSSAEMMIDSGAATDNTNGIAANGTGAIVRFTRTSVTGNATGVLQVSSGSVLSESTNSVYGNGTDGTYGTVPQN